MLNTFLFLIIFVRYGISCSKIVLIQFGLWLETFKICCQFVSSIICTSLFNEIHQREEIVLRIRLFLTMADLQENVKRQLNIFCFFYVCLSLSCYLYYPRMTLSCNLCRSTCIIPVCLCFVTCVFLPGIIIPVCLF
jgi:hypothetical protein